MNATRNLFIISPFAAHGGSGAPNYVSPSRWYCRFCAIPVETRFVKLWGLPRVSLRVLGFSRIAKGQPGQEYVAGGVDISVGVVAAALTSENSLPDTVFRCPVAALAAGLGGVPGFDRDHVPTSFLRFVGDEPQQLTPARVKDGSVQGALG
jgi:hypothetical protein